MRDFNVGRSAVYAEHGMAATAHPAATLAALDVLRRGGNAVDAAITACALLCVIEAQATGIGGDCFVLYAPEAGAPIGLNGSGRAPAAADVGWYAERGIAAIDPLGPHAVTVPGAIDAWTRLHADHGRLPWAELLQPAIKAAADGYILSPRVAWDWSKLTDKLGRDPDAKALFMPDGRTPSVGARHRQPALAQTLARIARDGRDGFYTGAVAEDIVAKLRRLGGLHTLDDFAAQRAEYVTPIATDYRGHQVVEIPPNGQGITALMMLNVLSGYALADLSEADRIHLLAEAAKAAYLRRDALIADPRFGAVPVERLLSAAEAETMRAAIRLDRAGPPAPVTGIEHKDTTYLCVVDRDRNAISFINSLFAGFGTGILAPASGVMLQNRGFGFTLAADHPNRIAGGKRPMHTIIPAMLMKDGRSVMPFGVMGGHFQPVGHTSVVTNMLDLGCDPQEALARPRSFAYAGELKLEPTIGAATAAALADKGHKVSTADAPHGGGQAIWIDHAAGTLIGGSEPRKDGCALGY